MNALWQKYETLYRNTLLQDVIPFWEKHSLDRDCGGFFTCLDRSGQVYDEDKFVWLQGRQTWMFAKLYNQLEKNTRWLSVARHGMDFLKRHGRNVEGNWYFAPTRKGEPLTQPYSIFSDCFAAMAFSQYFLATGDPEAGDIARQTYTNIWRRKENPEGPYATAVPEVRPLRAYVLPMILINLALEMEGTVPPDQVDKDLEIVVDEVMSLFLDKQRNLVYEYVAPDGSHPDCIEGRLLNPGHGIEGMWFVMDVARRRGDMELMKRAVDATLSILKVGWDRDYGGIHSFLDALGKPLEKLEWDQKLWWVHLETLVALLMGFASTGRQECWEWFERVHDYSWCHFADPEFGEWFGYLNRKGDVLIPLKGGKWKGCFHVPRALWRCYAELESLLAHGAA